MTGTKSKPKILVVTDFSSPKLAEVVRQIEARAGYKATIFSLPVEAPGRKRMLDSIKLTPLDLKVERQRLQASTFKKLYGKKGK